MILLLIGKVLFIFFFKLENDLSEIETSENFIASFYLKMYLCIRSKLLRSCVPVFFFGQMSPLLIILSFVFLPFSDLHAGHEFTSLRLWNTRCDVSVNLK